MDSPTLDALRARAKKQEMSIHDQGDGTYRLSNDDLTPMGLPAEIASFTMKELDCYISAMEHSERVGREAARGEYPSSLVASYGGTDDQS